MPESLTQCFYRALGGDGPGWLSYLLTTMTQEGMMGTEMGRHLTELRRRARKDNKPKTRDKRAKDKRETRNAYSKRSDA